MRHLYTRRNIIIGLGILLFILLSFIFIAYRNIRKAARESQTVDHTLLSLRVLEDLMDDMQDIETSQRGYVISGNRQFLEPYFHAMSDLNKDSLEIIKLKTIYPDRVPTLARILGLVKEKIEFVNGTINMVDQQHRDSANLRIQSGYGKVTMDSLRAIIFNIENTDRKILLHSNNERQVAAISSTRWVSILVVVFLAGLLVLAIRVVRDLRLKEANILARQRNEELLSKFNEELNRQVQEKTAAIRTTEERYKQIVETANEGIWMIDKDNKTVFVNKRMTQMLGYKKEEMIGRSVFDFLDEEGKSVIANNLTRRRKGISEEQEFKFYDRHGKDVWVLMNATPVLKDGVYNGALSMMTDITERKKALDGIRRSNESFQLISKTTNDAVWEWNLESGELWANETHQHLYGLAASDPVPSEHVWAERIHPEDRMAILKKQKETLASDKNVFISEYRFNTAQLGYRDIYDRCYIVRNKSGKPVRMTGSMMDITERNKTAAALQKEKELSDTAVNSLPGIFYMFDVNRKFLRWNKNFETVSGYTAEEIRAIDPTTFFAEEDRQLASQKVMAIFTDGSAELHALFLTKKGEKIPYFFTGRRVVYDGIPCMVGTGIDLSDIYAAQRKLVESEMRLRTIINSEPQCIKIVDRDGCLVDMNPAGLAMIEADSLEQVKGKPIANIIDEAYRPAFQSLNENVFHDRAGTLLFSITGIKGTRRWLETHAVPMKDPDGNIISLLGVTMDVTEKRLAEQELAQSNESLRKLTEHLQNIREEERSHIAREIHDELGQQLTVLKMDISWLNKKIDNPDSRVKQRLEELVAMIDTTVRSVRKISSELRPSMLDDLGLAAAMDWQSHEFEKRSGIRVHSSFEIGELKLPNNIAITVFRIFQESLTNVARHAEAKNVEVRLGLSGNNLELSVRDDGKGFIIAGIENKKTLGILGMKERVAILKGNYMITSEPGHGTTVQVRVPLNDGE